MSFDDDMRREAAAQHRVRWRRNPRVLLHQQIPKPMHQLAPRVVLGAAWWDAERRAAFAATDQHCLACGAARYDDPAWPHLEGHEAFKIDYRRGRMVYVRCIPLCHWCHAWIHVGRTKELFKRGKITRAECRYTMRHGAEVLESAGLRPLPPYDGPIAAWSAWRLVIGDREWPPLWRDCQHWLSNFNPAKEE